MSKTNVDQWFNDKAPKPLSCLSFVFIISLKYRFVNNSIITMALAVPMFMELR